MPFDTTQLLSLVNMSPRSPVDINISTLPLFVLEFNIPVNANLVNTAVGLNQFIILIRKDVPYPPIAVTSGTVDPIGRTLTFQPVGPLIAGATYQVTLKKEIRSAAGRAMEVDRVWSFVVDSSTIGQVQLLSPGDTTGVSSPPALCFQTLASTGNITYDIQLATSFLFGSLVWETMVTVSGGTGGELCVNIGIPLVDRTEYFWRVFAFTSVVSGNFSDTRSFFLGDSVSASPDTVLIYDPSPFFRLIEFVPDNGTPNLLAHPTIIATFSQPLSGQSINTSSVQVFVAPVDGRTAVPTFQDLNAVYTVVGNQILISPSTLIQPNQRYTIVLNPTIESVFGTFFNETFTSYYTSFYKPIYGGTIGVRSRLGGFINTVSDDEIMFFLWRASLHVNELLATRVFRVRDRIAYDELVAYDPPFKTYGQEQYAELYATAHLIESFYYDLLQDSGRRTALSVFEYEVQVSILSEIRERLKEVRKEMWVFGARFLREVCLPRVGMKSQFFNPVREQNPLARDWSFHPRRRFTHIPLCSISPSILSYTTDYYEIEECDL